MEFVSHVLQNDGNIKLGAPAFKLGNVKVISSSGSGDYTDIATAVAAEPQSTTFLIDAGTYSCDNIAPKQYQQFTGMGNGLGGTILEYQGSAGNPAFNINVAGVTFFNVQFLSTSGNPGGVAKGIRVSSPGVVYLYECRIQVTNNGSGSTAYGVDVISGSAYFYDCDIDADGDTEGLGIQLNAITARSYVYGGSITASGTTEWSVYCLSGGIPSFYNLPWLGKGLGGTISSQVGSYSDATGNLVLGDEKLIIDADGDSEIYSSTDDEVIHTVASSTIFTTKSTGIVMPSGKDVYPNNRTYGIDERYTNLVGGDVPADDYHFTWRTFRVNDFTNHKAGFEDSQASPYSFGGSPGGFSVSVPANTQAKSNYQPHHLTLQCQSASGVYLQWTSSTAKNNLFIVVGFTPLMTAADYNLAEFRVWSVQSPGASDTYWANRINWLGATYPQHPLRFAQYYGTGVTYGVSDGTLTQTHVPLQAGTQHRLDMIVTTGPSCYSTQYVADGSVSNSISNTQAGYPTSFKTLRIRGGNAWTQIHIDDILIT